MKYIAFILLLCVLMVSCDPGYGVHIRNKSGADVFIKTKPSIESFYSSPDTYRDSILNRKVEQKDGISTYRIKPNDNFLIMSNIGGLFANNFGFDWLELISAKDTIILDSREKIIERLKAKNFKQRIGFFSIDVNK